MKRITLAEAKLPDVRLDTSLLGDVETCATREPNWRASYALKQSNLLAILPLPKGLPAWLSNWAYAYIPQHFQSLTKMDFNVDRKVDGRSEFGVMQP